MDTSTKINLLLDKLGVSVLVFEKKIGVKPSLIAKAIQRNSKLKDDTIDKIISAYPSVNRKWIETGEGDIFTPTDMPNRENINSQLNKYDEKYTVDELINLHLSSTNNETMNRLLQALSDSNAGWRAATDNTTEALRQNGALLNLLLDERKRGGDELGKTGSGKR